MEVTDRKVAVLFAGLLFALVAIGAIMQVRHFDQPLDDPKDCVSCNPHFDKQIPLAEAFLKLLSASPLPMFGICNSCKVNFDGSAMRRVGDYCVTWKDDDRVIDTFDFLIPQINLTCKCNSLLSGVLTPSENLTKQFPCLKVVPSAISAVQTSRDLSLEALEICRAIAMKVNTSSVNQKAKADITISIQNFRLHSDAVINKTKHLVNLVVRLSHMSPKNVKITCNVDPVYRHMCKCLEDNHLPKLVFFFIKSIIPCALQDTLQYPAYNVLRDFAFCYPKKPGHLWKTPYSVY